MADQPDSDALQDRVERLEALVEQQQETINELREDAGPSAITRRAAIAGLVGAGGVGALAGNVLAAPSYGNATGDVGTSNEPTQTVVAQTGRFQDVILDSGTMDVRSGPFDLSPTGADLQLATGQSLVDGSGADRVQISSDRTVISNEAGKAALDVKSGVGHDLIAGAAEPVRLFDSEGSFTAFEYSTSSSRPGSLVLKNTVLDFQAGQASITKDSMTANPETDSEDGFLQVEISGTRFQVPIYDP